MWLGSLVRNSNSVAQGFLSGSVGKESTCGVRDLGSVPGLERSPGEGKLPTPVFWPGEFHGQRSLAGYSPWVTKSQTRLRNFHFTSGLKMN